MLNKYNCFCSKRRGRKIRYHFAVYILAAIAGIVIAIVAPEILAIAGVVIGIVALVASIVIGLIYLMRRVDCKNLVAFVLKNINSAD